MFTPSQHSGTIHHFASRLVAFEYGNHVASENVNVLIWIGGLGDGLLLVPYTHQLANSLPSGWSFVQPLLGSSYTGWGTSSLRQDVKELGKLVDYLKKLRPNARIVLMGHSTGSQDCMEYVVGEGHAERPTVQGIILQAGLSDREALVAHMSPEQYENSCKTAEQWVDEGRGEDVLPLSVTTKVFGSPCSAERWLSLTSPDKKGADDYFSSDLPTETLQRTFGSLPKETPLLLLVGGKDPYIPAHVDRKALAERWTSITKAGGGIVDEKNGGVVEGATHSLVGDPEHVVQDLVGRVCRFLVEFCVGSDSAAHL